jgi:hypothetical protein
MHAVAIFPICGRGLCCGGGRCRPRSADRPYESRGPDHRDGGPVDFDLSKLAPGQQAMAGKLYASSSCRLDQIADRSLRSGSSTATASASPPWRTAPSIFASAPRFAIAARRRVQRRREGRRSGDPRSAGRPRRTMNSGSWSGNAKRIAQTTNRLSWTVREMIDSRHLVALTFRAQAIQ